MEQPQIQIRLIQEDDYAAWDAYVASAPATALYHLTGWKRVVEQAFGHATFYLAAARADRIVGALPLVFLKSPMFGRFFVSLPFFNYGGVLADDPAVRARLIDEAIALAKRERASHIEFRHLENYDLGLPVKTSKVLMILDLPETADALWNSFKSKLRSQIKRPEKEGFTVTFGQMDKLSQFYEVFAVKMRDLGTPVYSQRFFEQILAAFPKQTHICVVSAQERPIAVGFLAGCKEMLQIPWAATLPEFDRFSPNMMLYWHILKFACEQGYTRFDFGRSTPDEGTYRFKEQWGSKPMPCYWHYWLAKGDALPELNPHNPKYEMAIKLWRRLPLPVTKLIGPHLVKFLP